MEIKKDSKLTCPRCSFEKLEQMPDNYCVWFYECESCGTLLRPLQGDCCVFCSYGDVPCPPIQQGSLCCAQKT